MPDSEVNARRIKCADVSYRKGLIEVLPSVHPSCINLEIWNIAHDSEWVDDGDNTIGEASIVANTEVEMNVQQALRLVRLLEHAIARAQQS